MSLFKHIILVLALFLSSQIVQAKTVVLIHGLLADGMSWRSSGFSKPLEYAGFVDAGGYGFTRWGMVTPQHLQSAPNIFVTVDLPYRANIQTQESILSQYLAHLYSHRLEPMILVGHSAGGVVARLHLLSPYRQPVIGLITIAAPHLGTPAANVAYTAGNSPIGMMASMVGADEFRDARGLFSDLKEEEPNNFLYWMNHQPHPDIHYASIIRRNDKITRPSKFDYIVPPNSQNMNNIWALRKRSGIALSTESHTINGKDGKIVLDILNYIK